MAYTPEQLDEMRKILSPPKVGPDPGKPAECTPDTRPGHQGEVTFAKTSQTKTPDGFEFIRTTGRYYTLPGPSGQIPEATGYMSINIAKGSFVELKKEGTGLGETRDLLDPFAIDQYNAAQSKLPPEQRTPYVPPKTKTRDLNGEPLENTWKPTERAEKTVKAIVAECKAKPGMPKGNAP